MMTPRVLPVLHGDRCGNMQHVQEIGQNGFDRKAERKARLHEIGLVAFDAAGIVEFVEQGGQIHGVTGHAGGIVILGGLNDLVGIACKEPDELDLLWSGEQGKPCAGRRFRRDALCCKI